MNFDKTSESRDSYQMELQNNDLRESLLGDSVENQEEMRDVDNAHSPRNSSQESDTQNAEEIDQDLNDYEVMISDFEVDFKKEISNKINFTENMKYQRLKYQNSTLIVENLDDISQMQPQKFSVLCNTMYASHFVKQGDLKINLEGEEANEKKEKKEKNQEEEEKKAFDFEQRKLVGRIDEVHSVNSAKGKICDIRVILAADAKGSKRKILSIRTQFDFNNKQKEKKDYVVQKKEQTEEVDEEIIRLKLTSGYEFETKNGDYFDRVNYLNDGKKVEDLRVSRIGEQPYHQTSLILENHTTILQEIQEEENPNIPKVYLRTTFGSQKIVGTMRIKDQEWISLICQSLVEDFKEDDASKLCIFVDEISQQLRVIKLSYDDQNIPYLNIATYKSSAYQDPRLLMPKILERVPQEIFEKKNTIVLPKQNKFQLLHSKHDRNEDQEPSQYKPIKQIEFEEVRKEGETVYKIVVNKQTVHIPIEICSGKLIQQKYEPNFFIAENMRGAKNGMRENQLLHQLIVFSNNENSYINEATIILLAENQQFNKHGKKTESSFYLKEVRRFIKSSKTKSRLTFGVPIMKNSNEFCDYGYGIFTDSGSFHPLTKQTYDTYKGNILNKQRDFRLFCSEQEFSIEEQSTMTFEFIFQPTNRELHHKEFPSRFKKSIDILLNIAPLNIKNMEYGDYLKMDDSDWLFGHIINKQLLKNVNQKFIDKINGYQFKVEEEGSHQYTGLDKRFILSIIGHLLDATDSEYRAQVIEQLMKRGMIREKYQMRSFLDQNEIEYLLEFTNSVFSKEAANELLKLLFKTGNTKSNHLVALRILENWQKNPDMYDYGMIQGYISCPDPESIVPVQKQLCIENIAICLGFEPEVVNGTLLSMKNMDCKAIEQLFEDHTVKDCQDFIDSHKLEKNEDEDSDDDLTFSARCTRCIKKIQQTDRAEKKVRLGFWYFGKEYDDLKVAQVMQKITQHCTVESIQKMDLQNAIVNAQFEKTYKIYLRQFLIYILLYVMPLLYIIFASPDNYAKKSICRIIVLIVQMYFLLFELLQLKAFGRTYFKDFWNIIQLVQIFVTYTHLINLDVSTEQLPLKGKANYKQMQDAKIVGDQTSQVKSFDAFMNSVLIFFSVLQTLSFLRISKNFGSLVQLVQKCLFDMSNFLVFYFLLLAAISMINQAIGSEIALDDFSNQYEYDGLNVFNAYFLASFRNSLGDFTLPTYDYWNQHSNKSAMIHLNWYVWFISAILFTILLLNFLIAVISQSYEETMFLQNLFFYRQRVDLNVEAFSYVNSSKLLFGYYFKLSNSIKRLFSNLLMLISIPIFFIKNKIDAIFDHPGCEISDRNCFFKAIFTVLYLGLSLIYNVLALATILPVVLVVLAIELTINLFLFAVVLSLNSFSNTWEMFGDAWTNRYGFLWYIEFSGIFIQRTLSEFISNQYDDYDLESKLDQLDDGWEEASEIISNQSKSATFSTSIIIYQQQEEANANSDQWMGMVNTLKKLLTLKFKKQCEWIQNGQQKMMAYFTQELDSQFSIVKDVNAKVEAVDSKVEALREAIDSKVDALNKDMQEIKELLIAMKKEN